eukprot:3513362-Rhodomonas_salina.2
MIGSQVSTSSHCHWQCGSMTHTECSDTLIGAAARASGSESVTVARQPQMSDQNYPKANAMVLVIVRVVDSIMINRRIRVRRSPARAAHSGWQPEA